MCVLALIQVEDKHQTRAGFSLIGNSIIGTQEYCFSQTVSEHENAGEADARTCRTVEVPEKPSDSMQPQ